MSDPSSQAPPVRHVDTVGGFPVAVRVSGPKRAAAVVMFAEPGTAHERYQSVCERLHVALLRTVLISPDPRLTAKAAIGVLDAVRVRWALLVGDHCSGPLTWQLAASRPERFGGLVAVDVGHPRVPDMAGVVRDRHCPPIRVNTTALVSTPAARAVARASARFVHGDFRLAERVVGGRNTKEATSQLVTEIVLRSHSW